MYQARRLRHLQASSSVYPSWIFPLISTVETLSWPHMSSMFLMLLKVRLVLSQRHLRPRLQHSPKVELGAVGLGMRSLHQLRLQQLPPSRREVLSEALKGYPSMVSSFSYQYAVMNMCSLQLVQRISQRWVVLEGDNHTALLAKRSVLCPVVFAMTEVTLLSLFPFCCVSCCLYLTC